MMAFFISAQYQYLLYKPVRTDNDNNNDNNSKVSAWPMCDGGADGVTLS